MEQGCGRFLQTRGAVVRMLAKDRRYAERLAAGPGSPDGGFRFDLSDHIESAVLPSVRGEVLPAGEGRESHRFAGRILEAIELFSALPGGILLGPAEPVPLDRFAIHEGSCGMDAWPVPGPLGQSLLDAVPKNIVQAGDLGFLFGTDDDRLIAPRPDPVAPVAEPVYLSCEVGVEITHEARELEGVPGVEQQVIVRREKYESADRNVIQPLGSPQDPNNDLVELRAGAEEMASLNGAAGDLDEGPAFGDESESSAHAQIRRKIGPQSSSS